ncbi:MAG: sugar transporter [Cypionkella sp.]|uniref:sugar transporter n=1 Tax=Cypionkella sp. TaxID=2811411 RepID=UPI00271CEF7B|nr:sugar transporter [Cypionkella sp.]MDO8327930.1 sugar transporter [Cypionkella sp.]
MLTVVAPSLAALFYLFAIAEDQYASSVSFSVRSEDLGSALSLLGGLSSLSGASSSDADILYQFIQSQELVQRIDEKIDLHAIYSKPTFDPIYAFDKDGSIEDLVSYWGSMVKIFYDRGTGLIELRVQAFEPQDAQRVAQEIYDQSSLMINQLSAIGRVDTTRYAKEDLDTAVERLKAARTALTEFRSRTQIVDPSADIQSQMGLLNTLQQQMTASVVELNLLQSSSKPEGDPRIEESERRIAVIQKLIDQEREKFGVGNGVNAPDGDSNFSTLVGEFERLNVDREFAEKAYLAALATYDTAVAKAQRQSRYLAAHVTPTLAEDARYPQRMQTVLLVSGLLLAAWGIAMLVYYSVRDRR